MDVFIDTIVIIDPSCSSSEKKLCFGNSVDLGSMKFSYQRKDNSSKGYSSEFSDWSCKYPDSPPSFKYTWGNFSFYYITSLFSSMFVSSCSFTASELKG